MNSTQNINVGDTVKFVDIVDPGDAEARMILLEVEPDRNWALVEFVCDLPFRPTRTVKLSDLVKA